MRNAFTAMTICGFALGLASCGSTLTTDPTVTTTSEGKRSEAPAGTAAAKQGNALVRLINATPDDKVVDIVWNKEDFFKDIPFKTITPYKEVPRGTAGFRLREADGSDTLSAGYQELLPGLHYTLVALPKKKGGARLRIFRDPLGALDPGETRVRLINASMDLDDLDLFTAGAKTHILHGIDAGSATGTTFADMDAGVVEIRAPNRPSSPLVGKFTTQPGRLYTFVVSGSAANVDVLQVSDRTEP